MDTSLSKLWETVKYRETWYAAVQRVTKSQTQLSDWTTNKYKIYRKKVEEPPPKWKLNLSENLITPYHKVLQPDVLWHSELSGFYHIMNTT